MSDLKAPPREIGLGGAILINFNGAVGAGIFALPALLYSSVGTLAPLAILVFALFVACNVAIFAKLSTIFEQSGGPQLYAEYTFGKLVGFQTGWLNLCGNMVGRAANFHVLVSYLAAIFPVFGEPVLRTATMTTLIAAFALIAIVGTKRSIGAIGIGTILKLFPILAVCTFGLLANGLPREVALPEFSGFETAALLIAYAFSGSGMSIIAAGETRNPQGTLQRAIYLNLALVAVFYAFVQLCYISIAPDPNELDSPLAAAGGAMFGSMGVLVISLAAIFSVGTNQLNSFVVMPRILYGMGRRGLVPRVFAKLSGKFETPWVAIATYSAIVAGLAASGTFVILATLTVAAEQVMFIVVFFAFLTLWRRNEGGMADTMGLIWIPIVIGTIALFLFVAAQHSLDAGLSTLALIAIGFVLYGLARLGKHEHEAIRVGAGAP